MEDELNPGGLAVLFGLAGFAVVVLLLMMLVGYIMCIFVPQETGAKGLIIAALVVYLGSVFLGIVVNGISIAQGRAGEPLGALQILINIAALIGSVLFILFMRKLALYIQRPDIASRAIRTFIAGGISIALVFTGVLGAAGAIPQPMAMFSLLGAIDMLVTFVMYANMVNFLSKALPG